jgi:hypothetical protein
VCICGNRIGGEYVPPIQPPRHHPQSVRNAPRVTSPAVICAHRGEAIGKADCKCEGSHDVYQCGVHAYAMARKLKPGKVSFTEAGEKRSVEMAYCFGCDDFEEPGQPAIYPAIQTRNLIYHAYPKGDWLDAVEEISKHRHAFNGRVVVSLAVDPDMDADDARDRIQEMLRPTSIVITRNDRDLREVATFQPLLDSVLNGSPTEATLYAHTKGNTTDGGVTGAVKWRRVMAASLLGRWGDAMRHLRRYAMVGTHKMIWPEAQPSPFPTRLKPKYPWMHCGTFWWFRHDEMTARYKPELVIQDRYGVEALPAQMFHWSETFSMWQPWEEDESAWPQLNPYDPQLYEKDHSK